MADSDDPFLQVQSDVLTLLDTTRPVFQSYIRIRSHASTPNNPELRDAREELESNLKDLSTDLQDLVDTVKAVEKDPYRYGLEIEEVQRRRQLVADVGKEIEGMHQELLETVHDARKGKGKAADGLPHPSNFDSEDEENEGDGYGEFEMQRQEEIMAEQDDALEGVFRTVGNLRGQADAMGRELEEQAEILDEVDNVADRVGGKLQTGLAKIGYVIRKNEGMRSIDTGMWL